MLTSSRRHFIAVLLSMIALASACGDDDDDSAATDDERAATTTSAASNAGETVTVTGVDYAFEGVPDEIKAGTKVEFTNASTKELHEFTARRIPDSEKRPVSELVKLPEEESEAVFGPGKPAAVLIAPPGGGETIEAVGDGTLSEAGRYAVVCFIPTGADPAAFLEAMKAATGGPPNVPGGPPHVANGMFAELKVT